MTGQFNYRTTFRCIVAIAIFVFLGMLVWNDWGQIKDAPFVLRPFSLVLSIFIFAFSYFIQIWAWYLITLKLDIALSTSDTLKSWFYSQLGKYLPGKVWLLVGRFYFYKAKGKSKEAVSVALYLEMATMMMAAGLIFWVALIFHKEIWLFGSWRQSGWLVPVFLLGFIFLHPRFLQKILGWVLARLKREQISLSISYFNILWILTVCILCWAVGGIAFYFFVDSFYPVAPQYILLLTGALAISSTLGLIVILTPGGLGVREGVLVYLLSFVMATPVAVILSVLTRVWMTLIEIGLIGMIYLLGQIHRQEKKKTYRET